MIEADAVIQCKLFGELPFVLNVSAEIPAQQRIGIGDSKWSSCRVTTVGIDIEYGRYIGNVGFLRSNHITKSQCVSAVHLIRRVELRPIHLAGTGDVGGDTIEEEVVGHVGNEVHVCVAGEK